MAKKEIGQVHAVVGFRVFGRHDDRRYALRVLNGLLGENMSSRLFQSVREKHGLCYSIQSSYQLFEETGVFAVSGGFDSRRAEAVSRDREVIASRRRQNSGGGRIEAHKDYLLGSFRLGLEGTGNQMMFVGESMLNYGGWSAPPKPLRASECFGGRTCSALAADVIDPSA
jgi:predicted Zn-dependent peptidase